jgi:hypothetical protein
MIGRAAVLSGMKGLRNAHKILIRKPQCKTPLGIHRHIWYNNINMYLRDANGKGYGPKVGFYELGHEK